MTNKKCILIIEDEIIVQQSLVETLTGSGFETYAYESAEQVVNSDIIRYADGVIMDVGLPGINGWEATALIKNSYASIPIIILTAYSHVSERLCGFQNGADDYIIKPFFMEELLARLRTVLKRYDFAPGRMTIIEAGDLQIDLKSKKVIRNKQEIKLTLTEFNLLALLAEEQGNPVSKESIMRKIWKGKYSIGDNTIEVYINFLRNKIDKPFGKKLIHTKAGYGYFLADKI